MSTGVVQNNKPHDGDQMKQRQRNGARLVPRSTVALLVGVGFAATSCGPPPSLRPHALTIPLPDLPTHVVRRVDMPARKNYKPVPLVVILDDGPPVDPDRNREQATRIGQLHGAILQAGYAVWRPLEHAWPRDSVLVRCPDEAAAQVQMGLLGVRGFTIVDSSRVVVLGFGQGGVVGAMVAQRMDQRVYALGLIGTPARSIDRVILSSPLRDTVAKARMEQIFDDLWDGTYPDTARILNGTAGCWRAWLSVTQDMPDIVERLRQPVLVVQGTADRLLPILDIERFRRAIEGRPLSKTENAVGVRHDLSDDLLDPKQPRGTISPRFVPLVMNWLETVAPLPK